MLCTLQMVSKFPLTGNKFYMLFFVAKCFKPFNSQFNSQFQYMIMQTGEESRQIYQLEGVILI